MNGKILTISIAAYNVSKFLKNTVNSLIFEDDNFEKMEIIIVNDGSKDSTLDIAREYERKYPSVIKVIDKKNGGYGSTINESIKIASGKYYRLLDGDDWYKTENLSQYIKYLERCEADIVITPHERIVEGSNKIIYIDPLELEDNQVVRIEDLKSDNIILGMHSLAVKTTILQLTKMRITENCFYTDQEYNFYSLMASNTISKMDAVIYQYRIGQNEQSMSVNGLRNHYKDSMIVSKKLCGIYRTVRAQLPDAKRKILIQCIVANVINVYISHCLLKNKKVAKKELIKYDDFIMNNYIDIYNKSMENKKVKFLRISKFFMFCLTSKIIENRLIHNERVK